MVALGVFVVSMTALLFFLNNGAVHINSDELKANVIENTDTAGTENAVDNSGTENTLREQFQDKDDPYLLITPDGAVDDASANYESVTGVAADDIKGKTFYSQVNPDDLPTVLSSFSKVLETGDEVTMIGPYRIKDGNGEYRLYMGSFYPIKKDGKIIDVGVVNRDISNAVQENTPATDTTNSDSGSDSNYVPAKKLINKSTNETQTTDNTTSGVPLPEATADATWKHPKINGGKTDSVSGINKDTTVQENTNNRSGDKTGVEKNENSKCYKPRNDTAAETVKPAKHTKTDDKWIISYIPSIPDFNLQLMKLGLPLN
jgi:PAS domain S-box-containing protein